MNTADLITNTAAYVRQTLKDAEGGHNWWHILRVWNTAKSIAQTEEADMPVVELAALLHDIADSKFHNGDETIGPKMAGDFLISQHADPAIIEHVQQIIAHMSFKNSFGGAAFTSKEMEIVQDADRLDAIGAIGIARAFNYGGFKGRDLYDPEVPTNVYQTKAEYKNSTAPTINHFYEKLLLLKDSMNTATGRQMAEQRHVFMEQYLTQFYAEWNGER
jgi:uncharacterized protein